MRDVARFRLSLVLLPVAALTACTSAVNQPATPTTTPAAATTTTSAATAATTTPAPVLGLAGYGALHLGMTKAQAIATGLTTGTTGTGTATCGGTSDGFLAGTPNPGKNDPDVGRLYFSAQTGKLVAIYAYAGIKTPEGIGLGSTYDQLIAIYPDYQHIAYPGNPTDGRGRATVPGNPNAHYRIVVTNSKIIQLSLDSNNQDCYE